MKITVITPTCDRSEGFMLCERWMARQSFSFYEWIVLDDGIKPVNCTMGQRHYLFTETRGAYSLVSKLSKVFDGTIPIFGDVVAIVEDDDWYSSEYMKVAASRINGYDMIGEGCTFFYHVGARRYGQSNHRNNASLSQTIINKTLFPILANMTKEDTDAFIDWKMWNTLPQICRSRIYIPDENCPKTLVGIKGMYSGYSACHSVNHSDVLKYFPNTDPVMDKLVEMIGKEDADHYAKYVSTVFEASKDGA